MISSFDLTAIARDVDQAAVVRLIRRHCWQLRQQRSDYSPEEQLFLAAIASWKPAGPRPLLPAGFTKLLAAALVRELPVDPDEAQRLARHVAATQLPQETR